MTKADEDATAAPAFVQPKRLIRWGAVALALAGWYSSWYSFRVSAGDKVRDPLMGAVCDYMQSAEENGCETVLTTPRAFFRMGPNENSPRIPLAAAGMAYFAFLGLWYLFVGPPTHAARGWHLVIAAVVFWGAVSSAHYVHVMANVLHAWCGSCVVTHIINGAMVLLTLLAWPWRKPTKAVLAHPSTRLALAAGTSALLAFAMHFAWVYVGMASAFVQQRAKTYAEVLDDPEYIRWDFGRQPTVSLNLRADEPYDGPEDAAHTVVVFGDFQCRACLTSHKALAEVAGKYPGSLRIAFRYYPQDGACNPDEHYRNAGHPSGCRAAYAAEAALMVAGREAYIEMQRTLWDRQAELPDVPLAQQSEEQRELFAGWAAGLGIDRAAFATAMESPAVAARISADIELADELGIHSIPVIYLDGKRVRGWTKLANWDALLGADEAAEPDTAPDSSGS